MQSVFVCQELSSYPCLYAERVSSKSVIAGHMSSNWIVSALSVLATVGELYRKVSKHTYYCYFNIGLVNVLYRCFFQLLYIFLYECYFVIISIFPSPLITVWTLKNTGLNIILLPVMPTWHPCRLVKMTIHIGGLEIFCGYRYLKI